MTVWPGREAARARCQPEDRAHEIVRLLVARHHLLGDDCVHGDGVVALAVSVPTMLGTRQLTVIPSGPSSRASECVRPITAPFEAT